MKKSSRQAHALAKAAFQYAKDSQSLKEWSSLMRAISVACACQDFIDLLKSPTIKKADKLDIIMACLDVTEGSQKEWLQIMAQQHTMSNLVYTPNLFDQMLLEHENKLAVTITSHSKLNPSQQEAMIKQMESTTHKTIIPTFQVDHTLLGGITIESRGKIITNTYANALSQLTAQQV